jgi:hypothetical protein
MTNQTSMPDAGQKKLLVESLSYMALAQNVSRAHDAPAPQGWRLVATSDPPDEKTPNGLFAKIYERTGPLQPGEKKYVVAFRGTDKASDHSDIDSDLEIAFRKVPDQYWQALDFVETACRDNGINPSEMAYTGHSLGGYLAKTVGTTLGARSIWTFNSPGPTQKIQDELNRSVPGLSAPPGDGLVQIRSEYDLISEWGVKEGITLTVKTVDEHHGLDSLHTAIESKLAGAPDPVHDHGPGFSLARVFNSLSSHLARNHLAGALINRLMGDHGPAQDAKMTRRPMVG